MNKEINKRNLYFIVILILVILIDVVIILNVNRKTYTVVFVDGDVVSPFIVEEKTKVLELENKKENFIGWYLDDTKFDFNNIIHDDTVLKAKYKQEITWKVTFDSDGGSLVEDVTAIDGNMLNEPDEPTKENYIFKGWFLDEKKYDFSIPVKSDLALKALWEEVPDSEKIYTITFDSDGGSDVEPVKVKANEYPLSPAAPQKVGYTFKGWYLNNKLFSWNFGVASNITLKAKWTARKKIKISFDAKGGAAVAPIDAYKGDAVELPITTKAGYVFGGWYYGRTKYTNEIKINSSIKLSASWITVDEANARGALQSIKSSYDILKGGTKIKVTYVGCVITNTNSEILDVITRNITDKTLKLKFDIECGTVKKKATSKAIIKASTYSYIVENSQLTLNGTNYDGEIFRMDGTKIGNVLTGNMPLSEDLKENIILIFHDDHNTKYVLKRAN